MSVPGPSLRNMAEHQNVHKHYHYVVQETEPDVPFWQVCVVLIGLIFLGFLVAFIVTGYFWAFVAIVLSHLVLPAAAGIGIVNGIRYLMNRATEHLEHRSKLRSDADKQHQQIMSGDDAGIYGNYPPAC